MRTSGDKFSYGSLPFVDLRASGSFGRQSRSRHSEIGLRISTDLPASHHGVCSQMLDRSQRWEQQDEAWELYCGCCPERTSGRRSTGCCDRMVVANGQVVANVLVVVGVLIDDGRVGWAELVELRKEAILVGIAPLTWTHDEVFRRF